MMRIIPGFSRLFDIKILTNEFLFLINLEFHGRAKDNIMENRQFYFLFKGKNNKSIAYKMASLSLLD